MSKEGSDGKSFAERFASKRSGFSSEALTNKNSSDSSSSSSLAPGKRPTKSVDPKKRALADSIYLVKGLDNGRQAWYYIRVDTAKKHLFLNALKSDVIHLEQYGVIISSAYGDNPPDHVTSWVKEEYGIQD